MAWEDDEPAADCHSAVIEPDDGAPPRFALGLGHGWLLAALAPLLAALFWLATWERKPTWHINFLPQGSSLATATGWIGQTDAVRVWDLASGRVISSVASAEPICSFAFSPDGKTLAIGDEDGAVECRDLATGARLFELSRYYSPVGMLQYSDDGKTLAAMWTTVGAIETYRMVDGAPRRLASVRTEMPGIVAISHDGQRAAVGIASRPGVQDHVSIYSLNRDSRDEVRFLPVTAHGVAFSHDNQRLALAGESEVRI